MPEPICPVRARCGACQLLNVPYPEQLARKQQDMERLFAPFNPDELRPIAGMDDPFHYRNKVTSPYVPGKKVSGRGQGGKANNSKQDGRGGKAKCNGKREAATGAPRREILCGMYAAGTHRVIATDECLIENVAAKRAILAIRSIMARHNMEPYDEDTGRGFVRHAVVRVGHSSGEMLITLATNEREFPASRSFCRELKRRVPEVTTIVQNVNTRQTNVILGTEEKTLYGPGFILDELCGLSFRISSHSFYQVNATQTEVLYRLAIGLAHLTSTETALDAYCGTGTIGLVAAHGLPESPEACAARVIGVDNVASAIKDARANARHNGIENAEFETGDAGAFMERLAKDGGALDVLFMDPPRAGSTERFLGAACQLAPERIVYISCNPDTQARDVRFLTQRGYRLSCVQPVDMFPHTAHTECICLLER